MSLEDGRQIGNNDIYKYNLGVLLTQDVRLDQAVKNINMQLGRKIALLNGVLWNQNISKENKYRIYSAISKSIVTYRCELRPIKKRIWEVLEAT